ncbi:hypothetical protein Pmar_PMAR004231 [Perkinsus marinus ATCC 50983]|uniref:Peptidase A2 domain-containing protein n=1 Tax=Perkinsus marinus (strain ATCC 50983 / TXsc) TaxID=423536 RepID=C5LPN7_PERM5|nr:hypothetical protein Pmar_PMAR004231 [Perkinsus marinus ATCC 50983]EER01357.1 hypothetical protein Pmar_PMAR004231 [Perkinsus marinus ATCC 50983]|eukprot:XP_002768639.1 hypothetical protein Pmar_PMAR004231 [Perkinsus marinus ATCC 50983]
MLQNNTIKRLFDECLPISFKLGGLEEDFAAIEAATTSAQHSKAVNALIVAIDDNLGSIDEKESQSSIADRMKQCFGWAVFVVESLAPGFDAMCELTILLAVRLLQRRAGISRFPVGLDLPNAREVQLEYVRVRALSDSGSDEKLVSSKDSRAIKLAYELPPPAVFKPDDRTFPYHLWKKDMKLQLAAMRLQGVTALHYVLRAVCDSVRRELWGIIQSPECISTSIEVVLEKIFSTLDTRFGKSRFISDALRRWHSFTHKKPQSICAFLATFDKEKSFYESATGRTLEEVDLVARLLDAVDPTLALKLQESHGSRVRSLSLEEIKSDLIFFEDLTKKAAGLSSPSISSSTTAVSGNRQDGSRKHSTKSSLKQENPKQKDVDQSTTVSSKKVIPRGRCYRCFGENHNANKCEAGAIAEYSSRCRNCGNYHATDACSLNPDDLVCGYCAGKGHRSSVCTATRSGKGQQQQDVHVVDVASKLPISTSVPFSPCTVDLFLSGKKLSCLVDTGADVSLIDSSLLPELVGIKRFPVSTIVLSGIATSGIEAREEVLIPVSDSLGQSIILPFLSVNRARPSVLLGRNGIAMLQAAGMIMLTSLLAASGTSSGDMIKMCSDRYQEAECPSFLCPSTALDSGSLPVSTNFVQSIGQGETSDINASLLLWHKSDAALGDFSESSVPHEGDFVALPSRDLGVKVTMPISVPPLIFPTEGCYRVHHSEVTINCMVKTIDQLVSDLGKKSIPVENAPGYELFISRCDTGDALDTPEQRYKFEIDWPMEPSAKASWDSTRMMNSLESSEKALLKKETDMYLSNGWWTPDDGARPKGLVMWYANWIFEKLF